MFKRFCWHKWKYVYRKVKRKFMNGTCYDLHKQFRICEKCGKAQAYETIFTTTYTKTLDDCRTKILLDNIVDEGDYFVLKEIIDTTKPPEVTFIKED